MKCRQCGTVNVPSAKFCSHCGASLSGGMVAEGIAAKVEPSTVAIPAGGHAELTVSVRNDTHLVEHVDLSIDDPTAAWAKVSPAMLRMMPGTTSAAVVRLEPPRSAAVAAGLHPLRVTVTRSGSGELLANADARIELGPFYEVSAQVIPRDGAAWFGSRRVVWLDNTANAEVTVHLAGSDPDNALRFSGIDEPLTLPPGAKISRAIRVNAHVPNVHVRRKRHEFAIAASWGERQQVVASAALFQRSLFPLIALGVLVLLAALLLLVLVLLIILLLVHH
jgi:hypothetical protein